MDILMDIIDFISHFFSFFSSLSLDVIGGFVRDIAVAVSAIWAVWEGHKGVRKYLYDEDIKERTKSIRSANAAAQLKASIILNRVDDFKWNDGVINDDDIQLCISLSEDLDRAAQGASSSVQTYSFLLRRMLLTIESKCECDDSFYRHVTKYDVLRLMVRVVGQILDDSALIVDVADYSYRKSKFKAKVSLKMVYPEPLNRYASGRFGLDLRPQSTTSYKFYLMVLSETTNCIFQKLCLEIFRANDPAVIKLFDYGVYAPPMLKLRDKHDSDSLEAMISEPMFLIGAKKYQNIGEKEGAYWRFFYSSLNGITSHTNKYNRYMQIKNDYVDSVLESNDFTSSIENYRSYAEEIYAFEVKDDNVKRLRGLRKMKLKKWLNK